MHVDSFQSIPINVKIESLQDVHNTCSYAMGCSPVREDNPRALASGLSYVQVDKHGFYFMPPTSV